MTVHQYTREGNLLKTCINVLPRKQIVVAKVCGETYSKNDIKRWSRKTATNVNELNPQIKRGTLRERERESKLKKKP